MAGNREKLVGSVDFGTANVCAILGTFTPDGIDIVYKNLQARVFHQEHVNLDLSDKGEVKKESVKRGKYVR